MPYVRKYRSRRPLRRRPLRRRAIPRAPRTSLRKFFRPKYFEETFSAGLIQLGGGVFGLGGKFATRLADLPNATSIQNLFDAYNITSFKVQLVPRGTMVNFAGSQTGTASLFMSPRITYAISHDASEPTPTSQASVMGMTGAQVRQLSGNRSIWISVRKPQPALQATDVLTNVSAGAQMTKGWNWFDTTQGKNLMFYGINYWFECDPALNPDMPICDVYYHVRYACKEKQ